MSGSTEIVKLDIFRDGVPGAAGGGALAGEPAGGVPPVPVAGNGNAPAPPLPPPPHPGSAAAATPVTEPASINFSNSRRLFSGTRANSLRSMFSLSGNVFFDMAFNSR
ncbi:hypothetical protein QMO14_13825 [Variovorax sp. CAN2819]|uniref:hypothetical protein n=1 Tax=Variovorax sp. CAN15 TaxID=3046727 RepID=UPI00264852E2|nr:hypothetical protein [Variovorax sp. CAN15]MDN6884677.1 hypothetical protein [Variovorax sp. CAN15]